MKVVLVWHGLVREAYRDFLVPLAKECDLTVVVPERWGQEPFEGISDSGYETLRLRPALSGWNHFHWYISMGRILRERQPDILHMHEEPYSMVTFLALRAARRLARTRCLFFTWQNIFKRYPFPFSAVESFVYSVAGCAMAGSEEAAWVLKKKGFAKPIYLIPQVGVDLERFKEKYPLPFKQNGRPLTIGYLGRLVPEKGIGDLLRAVGEAENGFALRIVGDGPLRTSIQSWAREPGRRLKLDGPIPSTQVPAFLKELDVLILPSRTTPRWKEQFGRVLVEAMAGGVCVVGSSSGEIPNVVGDAGMIFPEGDVEALRDCLLRLKGDPELRARLSRSGRNRVLERYTHKKMAQQTLDVYRGLCEDV